ncbi:MAG TPA: aldo/keto reductase [Burkholderiales bacterium]|nr:aldo/keto reductase [Burkholderiales bacterium]
MDPRRRALLGVLAAAGLVKRARAAERITRAIPRGSERLPLIGLGTWQTFDVGDDPGARAGLRDVLKLLDGNVVDSSPMYGSSESVAGDLIAELGMRERLFIATKVWTSGRADGIRQMGTSFRRLRVRVMDLMQVHNLLDVGTHTQTLKAWKAEGRVRYIGITHYTSSAYPEVERWLRTGDYDFLQINYSLDEPEAEERILPLAAEKQVAVIVNRPFGQGSLFRRVRGKAVPEWAKAELGVESWAQFFLKWIVAHPAVTCAIPGTSKPEHMRDNLGAGRGRLPNAALRRRMAQYVESL